MLLPVCIGKISISNRTPAVEHHIIADINTTMRDAFHVCAQCALKEYDVTRLQLIKRYIAAYAADTLRANPAHIPNAAGCVNITDESGTIEARVRIGSAPDIWETDILGSFIHKPGKRRIRIQRFLWDVIEQRLL